MVSEVELRSTDERMTRGSKKTDHQEEPEGSEPAASADQQDGATSSSLKLEELTGMVKSLLRSQASRDQQLEKESTRQEQRWRSLQHQFLQIQAQVKGLQEELESTNTQRNDNIDAEDGATAAAAADQPSEPHPPRVLQLHKQPKIMPLSPDEDIEHYLATFERIATVCHWPKEEWAIQLIPLLTGKCLSVDGFK